MTITQVGKWNEMTPRERDALVAEKVMGLDIRSKDGTLYAVPGTKNLQVIPKYTTDISTAWEVVKKMPTLDPKVAGQFDEFVMDQAWFLWQVTPEKICLAALRAMGGV